MAHRLSAVSFLVATDWPTLGFLMLCASSSTTLNQFTLSSTAPLSAVRVP